MDGYANAAAGIGQSLAGSAAVPPKSQPIHERMDAMVKHSADIMIRLDNIVGEAFGRHPETEEVCGNGIESDNLVTRARNMERNLSRIDHLVSRLSNEL